MQYTKEEATVVANKFITELLLLQIKYGLTLNSDTGDVYFSYKSSEGKVWDSIPLGWDGDGTGIKVKEDSAENIRQSALAKLSKIEREALGV